MQPNANPNDPKRAQAQWRWRLWRNDWFWKKEPKQPFFILGAPRTGSQLLLTCFNSLKGVSTFSEILGKDEIGLPPNASRAQAITHIRRSVQALPTEIGGVKLFFWQMRHFGVDLSDVHKLFPQARYLVLYRPNLFDQYLSLQLAQKTGKWSKASYETRVQIDPADFLAFCRQTRADYRAALASPVLRDRSLLLDYDTLAADPAALFREQILPFLQLPPQTVQTPLQKQNNKTPEQSVDNFAEIEPLLSAPEARLRLNFVTEPTTYEIWSKPDGANEYARICRLLTAVLPMIGFKIVGESGETLAQPHFTPSTPRICRFCGLTESINHVDDRQIITVGFQSAAVYANRFDLSPETFTQNPYDAALNLFRFFDWVDEAPPSGLKNRLLQTLQWTLDGQNHRLRLLNPFHQKMERIPRMELLEKINFLVV